MSTKFVTNLRGDNFYTPNEKMKIKDEPVTPIDEDFGDHYNVDCMSFFSTSPMKKSMSMNDLTALREEQERERKYSVNSRKGHPQEFSKSKFISLAEAVYHYHRDTPRRYHTSRPQIFQSHPNIGCINLTRPQSPILRCKARSRPVHAISQKEKEEMELEQMKKFKIKAQPIPKSVFDGPINLPEVPSKPVTIIEPFNLTKIQKKIFETSNEAPTFKARPAPKHILEKPDMPVHVIRAVSPNLQKPKSKFVKPEPFVRLKPVKPKPFSFEKRDEELKKRKEEKIKHLIEEEKKLAASFKAQPLPGAVRKHMGTVSTKSASTTSSENKENEFIFRAKPPTVLSKEPFKPILQSKYCETAPFDLMSEKRAMERQVFERQLKEKEEEMERMWLLKKKELKEMQEKAEAELRAKTVHHAKPVPNLAPFIPESSAIPLTVPQTPTFVRRLKRN